MSSTPVGFLALMSAVMLIGGFLGAATTIRKMIVNPLRSAAEKVHDLADLPDAVRDLTQTLTRYVAEAEQHRQQVDTRLARVENLLSLWAFRSFGPPRPGDDEPPDPPPASPAF